MAEDKDDKKSEQPAAAAAPAPAKKAKKPAGRYSEASWNAFGAVLLAGFGVSITGMASASFYQPGPGGVITLLGGLGIFILSALFTKMTVTELGRAFAAELKAAKPADDADGEPGKDTPKGRR
jgi:hypothetical protein